MTHFEHMESIGQTNIFEFLEPSTMEVKDKVMIVLPDRHTHSDIYYYLLYYHPQVINKQGVILDRRGSSYFVSVEGYQLWLGPEELSLIHL